MYGLNGREVRFALVISAAHFGQHFLTRLIPPLIPVLAVALSYPLWQLGLLITVFSLGSGLGQAPFGALADRYDRLYILPAGFVISGFGYLLFTTGSLLEPAVPAITLFEYTFEGGFVVLCLAMAVAGFGTAVVHPTSYPLITVNVSDDNKGKVLGAYGSSSKIGDAAAPATVGLLILALAWQNIILILGAAGVVFGVLLFAVLRADEYETAPASRHKEDDKPEESADTSVATDRRTYLYPMSAIYIFFVSKMFASHGIHAFLPAFIVSVYAYSFDAFGVSLAPESIANFYFAALMLFAAVTQLALGGVTDRYDSRAVILGCLAAAVLALVGFAVIDLPPLALLLVMLLLGGGLWGLNPARDALISNITPPEREGRTFGYLWTAVFLTGAPVPVIVGYVIEAVGMRQGFLVLAVGPMAAGLAIMLLFSDRVYVAEPSGTEVARSD